MLGASVSHTLSVMKRLFGVASALTLGLVVATLAPRGAVGSAGGSGSPTVRADAGHRADPRFGPSERRAAESRAQQRSNSVAARLGLPDTQRLVVRNVERDTDGTEHVHYDRTYRGLPVVGGDLIVHQSPAGTIRSTDWGAARRLGGVATVARISATTARGSNDRLVVFAANHAPVLAWAGIVRGHEHDGTPINDVVYTDATTGQRLGVTHRVMTDTGTGRTLYSGSVVLQVAKVAGKWTLTDTANGNHRTYAKGHSTSDTRGALVSSADKIFGNGSTTDGQSAAADAHFGAARTWGFYKFTFGRIGIRGDGVGAYSRVHYDTNYANAFWDDACFCMTYGDGGGGSGLRQLVSLDVAGHEMTHGVTAQTAGLEYDGEAGGLNEATSDVMGSMVEFYAARASDPGDYFIGEKIVAVNPFYLRRMDDPRRDGASRNCWSTTVKDLDPHLSSGVGNHLFYLLAEGTGTKTIGGRSHTATSCNSTTFGGVGRAAAAQIWYRALTTYWLSSETYRGAANGMVRAAEDLYGRDSATCLATVRAWRAVSVTPTADCAAPTTGEVSDNAVVSPSFEPDNGAWTAPAGVLTTLVNGGRRPRSGEWYAALAGTGATRVDLVGQELTVPAGASARLTFFVRINTQEDIGGPAFDTLQVQVVDGAGVHTRQTYSNRDYTFGAYYLKSVDLSPWVGQTVTIRFRGSEDETAATAFLIDDVAVSSVS